MSAPAGLNLPSGPVSSGIKHARPRTSKPYARPDGPRCSPGHTSPSAPGPATSVAAPALRRPAVSSGSMPARPSHPPHPLYVDNCFPAVVRSASCRHRLDSRPLLPCLQQLLLTVCLAPGITIRPAHELHHRQLSVNNSCPAADRSSSCRHRLDRPLLARSVWPAGFFQRSASHLVQPSPKPSGLQPRPVLHLTS